MIASRGMIRTWVIMGFVPKTWAFVDADTSIIIIRVCWFCYAIHCNKTRYIASRLLTDLLTCEPKTRLPKPMQSSEPICGHPTASRRKRNCRQSRPHLATTLPRVVAYRFAIRNSKFAIRISKPTNPNPDSANETQVR